LGEIQEGIEFKIKLLEERLESKFKKYKYIKKREERALKKLKRILA